MATLVECLLSVHNTLGSFHLQYCINRVWWQLPEIPELWMKRQEKQKFWAILSYRACLRPGWAHETLYPRKESERGESSIYSGAPDTTKAVGAASRQLLTAPCQQLDQSL